MTIKNLSINVNLTAESSQALVNDIIGETTNKNALKYMIVDALAKYTEVGGSLKSLNKLLNEFEMNFEVKVLENPPARKDKSCRAVESSFNRYPIN